MRALQDFAVEHPEYFDHTWATLHYGNWDDKSGHWTQTLRTREQRDMDWVASLATPS